MARPWISFDLDHTLMINPFRRWVFPEVEAWMAPLLASGSPPMERIVTERKNRLDAGNLAASYDWDDILRTVAADLEGKPPFTIEELVRRHAGPGKVWLFSDVLPGLDILKKKGASMAAATNGLARYQRPVTDFLGLTPYFTGYHTPCSLGCAKPDRQFFRFAAERPLIHVGDRLDQDILGANRAGAVSVWIHRDLPPDWYGMSLEERSGHPELMIHLEEKLKREGWKGPVGDENVPDYLVVSIDEVADVWEREALKRN